MPRGRKKKTAVPTAPDTKVHSDAIDSLYTQFDSILKKTKTSKKELAKQLSMSYQGFILSYSKKRLTLDKWAAISKFLNLPLTVQFELKSSQKAVPETISTVAQDEPSKVKEYFSKDDKLAALERHIALLDSRLNDKDVIISLLSKN